MKALLFILFSFSFGYSQTAKNAQDKCKVVASIVNHEKIIRYLHPESEHRKTLYLIKNDFCNFSNTVAGIQVVTVNERELKSKNFMRITSVKESDAGFIITIDYPIEGAIFVVQADEYCVIKNVDILEK